MQSLPEVGFLRLSQIVGRKPITKEQAEANRAAGRPNQHARLGIPAIIPVSAAAWWRGVKAGRYPQPIRHGGSTLWRVEDIRALIEKIAASNGAR